MIIDLRSDTVTKPTPEMQEYMFNASVGDDVFGEDEAINSLENYAAELFGMEAAIFCPSGTMTNQIAIKVHTVPGDEVICYESAHVYKYEGGGIAMNSGASVKLLKGDRGILSAQEIEANIRPDDIHFPNTSLVCLENTVNVGGGNCYELRTIEEIRKVCDKYELLLHLDGARLFNALVAKNQSPKDYGKLFDSISICLSKGLGAPIGSLLLGTHDFIKKAKRVRKVFGGGMRQAGYLAAAGEFALKNHVDRLNIDHQNSKKIVEAILKSESVKSVEPVETNIILFDLIDDASVDDYLKRLKENNILALGIGGQRIRFVTHLNINKNMVDKVSELV